MFLTSDEQFRKQYFLSSQIPVFVLIIIFMVPQVKWNSLIQKAYKFIFLKKKYNVLTWFIDNKESHILIVIIILIGVWIYSSICLIGLYNRLKRNRGTPAPAKKVQKIVILTREYNKGMLNFFLSLILPLITSFSLIDYPITSLIELVIIEYLIYDFFKKSSSFFLNITLLLIYNVNLFFGETLNGDRVYCFVLGIPIKEIVGKKVEVRYLTSGEYPPNQNICIYVKKEL
ncbi:hypothetical protein ACRPK1_00155 [Lactobacillus johnsonii]|uniref:hypothetical protein n=1 Tax=Lactobacillus johnsonii TaxID=33959 RepID=UPI003D780DF5